ncbi:MAG: RNA polymerase sigma factor [Eubacteriales bacterium]
MNRQDAEIIIAECLKPIFGFALKRCKNVQDAEDLSQEIILKAYRALISKDDIDQPYKFIWTIAHNALSNYYRDASREAIGISIDDMEELLDDSDLYMDESDHQQIGYGWQSADMSKQTETTTDISRPHGRSSASQVKKSR